MPRRCTRRHGEGDQADRRLGRHDALDGEADRRAAADPTARPGRPTGPNTCSFYSLEKVTGKSFIHGEIVGMGTVVATYMEGGDTQSVLEDLESISVRFEVEEE